jgi:hypothetical protein
MINDIDNINRSTWAAPNGDQWVFHAEHARDGAPIAEVFDAQGKLIGQVIPLSESRVVGFGAERVYLVRAEPKANAA